MFSIAFTNVLVTLLYILPGYLLKKAGKASEAHLSTLSAILIYVGTPCLEISAFMSMDYTPETARNMVLFLFVTLFLQAAFMGLIYLVVRKKYHISKYRILTIGSVLGNVGFFGLPVVRALLPDNPEVACYSTCFMVSMNILVFTVGVFCLTKDKKYMSLRAAFCNPTICGFLAGLPFFFFDAGDYLPQVLTNAISLVGSMTTPLCMFILGVRLASAPLKRIFSEPMVFVNAMMKLVVFPVFSYALVSLLPLPLSFRASVLILSATPCASVILNLAEIHKSETEMSANCIMVTTLLCFMTIPILTLLVK